ncbi:hypothetical protein [Corallococcus macrosporus]|uniref:Uncharacterized protein n=1 Tax=Corallococcus macrosporus DSM 14697 TaxID=1189310 RepID=A0A250K0X9_9BACT|nr:hypothetical protein [Corallococcus macrosporus]ATB49362.1 hypothetical protein MYMAC_005005 [Corallococcus macrosporus DSM 14697]
MTLCTGLAILGLCFPLPGTTRTEIEAAGWRVREEDAGRWWKSGWFSAGTYRVLAGVSGQKDRLQALIIAEPQSEYPQLKPLLDKHCSSGDGTILACRLAGRDLSAMRCLGGWMITAKGVAGRDPTLREQCEKLAPLFEEVLKEKK